MIFRGFPRCAETPACLLTKSITSAVVSFVSTTWLSKLCTTPATVIGWFAGPIRSLQNSGRCIRLRNNRTASVGAKPSNA